MNFWKKLFHRNKTEEPIEKEEGWEEIALKRGETNLHDDAQRRRYVTGCLEQIAESSAASERLAGEYNGVTAYLTDMEEIEALPEAEAELLKTNAMAVTSLEKERRSYVAKPGRMSDADFHRVECMEEEIEEGLAKIGGAEEYQTKIRQDLGRLDSEKHAYRYRRSELRVAMENWKGIAVICAGAIIACFLLLLALQFVFGLDAQVGYLITAAAAALALTLIDLKYLDAKRELKKVENAVNRLTILQNRVKIRYVNNTQLLEYYYLKYGVTKGNELKQLWKQFQTEREEREKYRQANADLELYQRELLAQLTRLPIQDPAIWLHQPEAIIEPKEMVEIRHGYIMRRQKLRAQMDYNQRLAEKAQEEIKSIVQQYPEYAGEILSMVEKYEN